MNRLLYALLGLAIAIALSIEVQAAPCYDDFFVKLANKAWEYDEIRVWSQQNSPTLRIIAETTCGKIETVGHLDALTDRALKAKLGGTNPPEEIEDISKEHHLDGHGFGYWRLLAAIYREHAVRLAPARSKVAHDSIGNLVVKPGADKPN